jgi:hypothetical protein
MLKPSFIVRLEKDMFASNEEFPVEKYPKVNKETFMLFLKRFNLLVELTPLHSRARSTGD